MTPLLSIKLADQAAEQVNRNHRDAIAELQRLRAAVATVKRDVVLADGVATPIAHNLGVRAFATHTPPRGAVSAGWIEEVRDGGHDPKKFVVLKANSFGASITVDIQMEPL